MHLHKAQIKKPIRTKAVGRGLGSFRIKCCLSLGDGGEKGGEIVVAGSGIAADAAAPNLKSRSGPHYPKTSSKGGRPPYPLETMLRIICCSSGMTSAIQP